jgi:hypothetical protein
VDIAEETFLFYFPPADTGEGIMPGYYWEARSAAERVQMSADGGRDVSGDAGAWREYERRAQAENECYL